MTTDTSIAVAAHRLALRFAVDSDIPRRYRPDYDPSTAQRTRTDTAIEKRFDTLKQSWEQVILTMLTKLDPDLVWRFINLSPEIDRRLDRVTDCADFQQFIDYLILRRAEEGCDPTELGFIAALSVAFQREVEAPIGRQERTEPLITTEAGPHPT
jgi:hypothetical protein